MVLLRVKKSDLRQFQLLADSEQTNIDSPAEGLADRITAEATY